MNFSFLPSLQHMATVKIALQLYYDSDIQTMLLEQNELPELWFKFNRSKYEYWIHIEKLAMIKLRYLPKSLQTSVANLLRHIDSQIGDWKEIHSYIEDPSIGFEKQLCWRLDGTVDFEQTAKVVVRNINVDVKTRFIMACTYFMEKEILDLWHTNKKRVYRLSGNMAVRFWLKFLKSGSSNPWREMIEDYFDVPTIRKKDCELRVSSFYRFLSENLKRYYARYISFFYSDDLFCCLRQLNETERLQMFQSAPYLLSRLLQWPYQMYLLDVSNRLWGNLHYGHFHTILSFLFEDCILKGFKDVDYFQLLREFWESSPDSFKEKVQRYKKDFKAIKAMMNYDSDIKTSYLEKLSKMYFWPFIKK